MLNFARLEFKQSYHKLIMHKSCSPVLLVHENYRSFYKVIFTYNGKRLAYIRFKKASTMRSWRKRMLLSFSHMIKVVK